MIILRIIGFFVLVFLPGSWITFSLALDDMAFSHRLIIGTMLSPVIVSIQFFILRLAGISFNLTVVLLILLNSLAILLILKFRPRFVLPDQKSLLSAGIIFGIMFLAIAPFLFNPQERLYSWEAWSQADVVYSFANGNLIPEEVELAGVRLSYPWVGHIYQAVLSDSLDTPPVTNYIWPNLIWVLGIFGLSAAIVAELGGKRLAQVTVAMWLSFGVNIVGYYGGEWFPKIWIKAHPFLGGIWGDNRYTPWLDKILFFGQMYFAMGLFMAVLYLMVRKWSPRSEFSYLSITTLLLCGLGLIYPMLLPPALAVVGAKALTILIDWQNMSLIGRLKKIIGYAVICLISIGITFLYIKFLTAEHPKSLIAIHYLRFMAQRTIESVVITSPLLIGLAFVVWRCIKEKRTTLIILLIGALASISLYILFDVPWYRNEYKFIFTAAMCLAPFAALAWEPFLERSGRMAWPILAVVTALLASPLAYHVYFNAYTMYTRQGPLVDTSHFDLRLADSEPLSGAVDTIRLKTPLNSILILDSATINIPTPTRRQLYVPPIQKEPYPGVLGPDDETLVKVRGYPAELLVERRSTINDLYYSQNPGQMAQALDKLLVFKRPLVFLMDEKKQQMLIQWLSMQEQGAAIYHSNGTVVWLIN